jgi:hypothetical protein
MLFFFSGQSTLQGIVELTGGESGYIRTLHHFLIVLLVVEVLFISLQRERSMVGKFSVGLLSFLLVVFFFGVFSWIYGYHEFRCCHGCYGEDFGCWNSGVGDRNSVKEVEGWLGFLVWFWVIGGRENARVFLCGFFVKFELTFSQNLMVARVFGRKYEVRVFWFET